ncbi:MAG: hypothetical protein R2717_06175 [Schumannella sp.]
MLPIALIGAYNAHPRGSKWPKPGRLPVAVVFGAPMRIAEGENPQQFMARIREQVIALHDAHADRILNPTGTTKETDR